LLKSGKDVDARDKPGHDKLLERPDFIDRFLSQIVDSLLRPVFSLRCGAAQVRSPAAPRF
jgi:hypothetical protein